jgi:hypothetical protein
MRWQLDSELNHRRAGFPPIAEDVIRRRFWQYLNFLQRDNLTLRTIVASLNEVTDATELWSSDLTDAGYSFEQRFGARWIDRTHKDTGIGGEDKFLLKWHRQFMLEREGE